MITVLMPMFNGERWLHQSIPSILSQTKSDFEFLDIDDGSTDASPEILRQYAAPECRFKILTQENQGIVAALNKGFAEARGSWIARIAAADLAYPDRLERQWMFVQENPHLAAAGSIANNVNAKGDVIGMDNNPFTTRESVVQRLASGRPLFIIHASMTVRRNAVQSLGGYSKRFPLTHDTDPWTRMAESGHCLLAQPEILAAYQIHDNGMTRHSFQVLSDALRWLEFCSRQGRRGRPEARQNQFKDATLRAPVSRRLEFWREDRAFVEYKSATIAFANRKRVRAARHPAISPSLDPRRAFGDAWGKAIRPHIGWFQETGD